MPKEKAKASSKETPTTPHEIAPAAGMSALARWKNASVALVAAAATSDDDDEEGESNQAKLYKLFSQTTAQTLTGAAARGAQAAAISRVKAASKAVGGKFLSEDEWQAMKSEMALLRETNKRLRENQDRLRVDQSAIEVASIDEPMW